MKPPGYVHISFILFRKKCAPNRFHHAHDCEGLMPGYVAEPGSRGCNSSAERVLAGPKSSCCGFVDHRNRRLPLEFLLRERAAGEHGNAKRGEILVGHAVEDAAERRSLFIAKESTAG